MSVKIIGAALVLASCGGLGFRIASWYRWEEASLRQMAAAMNFMECELSYRMAPLPELCNAAGKECRGCVSEFFLTLGRCLGQKAVPDVKASVQIALRTVPLPDQTRQALELLGQSLGRFDLDGQLKGLDSVRTFCRNRLEVLSANRESRLRSYQTLGLCAGAALVILFI